MINIPTQQLLESLEAGVVVHNSDSSIAYLNRAAAAMLGINQDGDAIGVKAHDKKFVFVQENLEPLPLSKYPVHQALTFNAPIKPQVLGIRPPDDLQSIRWVRCHAFPAESEDKSTVVVVNFIDISDQINLSSAKVESLRQLTDVLLLMLDAIEPEAKLHHEAVARICVMAANEMGLDASSVENLRLAALVHDVGKIYVPSDILLKTGELTNEERELMKDHAERGAEILERAHLPQSVCRIVREHHERWDGAGYPGGVVGNNTLVESRILCVVEALVEMTTHRPWAAAKGIIGAIEELRSESGRQHDPEVTGVVLRMIDCGKLFHL